MIHDIVNYLKLYKDGNVFCIPFWAEAGMVLVLVYNAYVCVWSNILHDLTLVLLQIVGTAGMVVSCDNDPSSEW